MSDILAVVMHWLHISSVATLIGGAIFARFVTAHAIGMANADKQDSMWEDVALHFKPVVYAAVAALTVSGLYNIIAHPGHTLLHNVLLAIKLLLALHVFAVMLLAVQPNNNRRARMIAGAAVSGICIIGISAYLKVYF